MREGVTGQVKLDSYIDAGVLVSVDLVNELTATGNRAGPAAGDELGALSRILAFDGPSLAALRADDVPGFVALAGRLREIFDDLHGGDVDAAADRLNALLARSPAQPHLAKEDGRWRLHHHPVHVELVAMYTAICAEALARVVSAGDADRLGTCHAPECGRVFVDVSKNGSRRFCTTTCQNRVKVTAFRRRRGPASAPSSE
ncbi:CGNR zinc finger domain-containing protein [Dactylosporangium sp. CA-139066]|uniref:CGNR zinc finger domain-containing protein n=1 Tax=Dactylosporangium sp. CA-139066 TaxID=3239930 RepID=UPI003D936F13